MDVPVPNLSWIRSGDHKADADAPAPHRLRRRLRRAVLGKGFVASVGAGAAYFLDPQNGSARRQRARIRANRSAHHVANLTDPPPADHGDRLVE